MNLSRKALVHVACLLLCLLLAASPVLAAGADSLTKGIGLYEQAEFEAAQSALMEAVNSGRLDHQALARAYAYLGLVHLARGLEQYALDSFGRAKGQDPSFRLDPALFPPAAIDLFTKATPSGQPVRPMAAPPPAAPVAAAPPAAIAPAPTPAAASPEPVAPAPETGEAAAPSPRGGYIIEVQHDDVTLDQGARQGVAMGQRFEIIEKRNLVHPVTGREITSVRQVAVVMVVDVQSDLSTAKFVSGRLDLLTPGLEAKRLGQAPAEAMPKPKPKPKPPEFQRRPGSQMRIMVMPPELLLFGLDASLDRSAFQSGTLAQALLHYPKLDAFSPDPAMLGTVNRNRPSTLAPAMEKLAADAVLFWTVSQADNSSGSVRLSFALYLRGSDSVKADDYGFRPTIKAEREFGPILAKWVAEELELDK